MATKCVVFVSLSIIDVPMGGILDQGNLPFQLTAGHGGDRGSFWFAAVLDPGEG